MDEPTALRLKKAMEYRQMKQIELVEATGIGKSAISQYLSGKIVPKQDKIYLIAKALGVNEGWLMGYNIPMERSKIPLAQQDEKDIAKIIEQMKERLSQNDLVFEGKPVTPENIQAILAGIQVGLEMAKKQIEKK